LLLICLRRDGSKRRVNAGYLLFLAFGAWRRGFLFGGLVWFGWFGWFVWFGLVLDLLAFPCWLSGLLALPLCGAAPTFFAAAKKVGKESGSHRQF
jgi:hypothetical protein